jgi:hypothetical protein
MYIRDEAELHFILIDYSIGKSRHKVKKRPTKIHHPKEKEERGEVPR